MSETTITQIPVAEIKPFISRARPRAPFERLKESIRELGLKVPVQVRPLSKRQGQYKYELIAGQGRVQAHKELRRDTIPALILDVPAAEVAGRFLSENVMRRKLSWHEKARLLKIDFDRIGTPTKADMAVLAARYFISEAHVAKLLNILQKASPNVRETIEKLTVSEAADLTSLPGRGQELVVDLMASESIPQRDIGVVVRRAKAISEGGEELSKTGLKQSIRRVGEELKRLRETAKNIRLKYALGPENLQTLLSDRVFREKMERKRIGFTKFEEAI